MRGLTMDYQLTVPAILRRTEALFASRPVVSRRPDHSLHRATYGACLRRARRLAVALERLGVEPGDRVATLCWNHHRHLEAYFAIPMMGAVLHTLNLRLHPDELGYIAAHAGDGVILVDRSLLMLLEQFRARARFREVIVIGDDEATPVGTHNYERLLAGSDESAFRGRDIDEHAAAAMCYTSGTTGRPKGVLYSHRALALHSMATAMADGFALREADVVLAVVPMFHANAWGLPFTAALVGAGLVFPGEHPDPRSLLELCQTEGVTFSAGVPTVWLGVLEELDAAPGKYDLSRLHTIVIGGAAAPESLMLGLEERHGLRPLTSWGMTELAPVGTLGRLCAEVDAPEAGGHHFIRMKQGRPGAWLELRLRNQTGEVPWDGVTMGELEIRGAYVAAAYYRPEEEGGWFTEDGWFRTGDIASIDPFGYLEIRDRTKDLIKSGGEWISSVALEGALMSHPAVAEAAVVAVPHPRWLERPVAAVVLREGRTVSPVELRAHLGTRFPEWWLPDYVVFLPAIPRTSTGKFLKSALRDSLRDHFPPTHSP
ncbi:MAG: long-chain fatty acid--CoA ligase [Gemmatimonadota bacterium]|nr:long-chain fatty acid--CoA ligase [Gemmatimonadota bacterium]